jgi:multidrug efflux pump subunit AcrA (membrane-fusion protein)
MKKKSIISLSLVVVLAAAAGIYFYYQKEQYNIIHLSEGDLTEAVYGLGKVKSNNRFEVIVGVISTVTARYVHEGDFVKKGQPLIRFDDALFSAPFSGTVTYAKLYTGETAVPHVPVLRLEDLTNRYIELSLEQQSILRVRENQVAKVSFESLRGKVLVGKVASIYSREDEFLVRIEVENLDPQILPGMTADVTIEIGSIKNALLIPLTAIRNGMVTVRRGRGWEKVKVDVGHVDGLFAEIKKGSLQPNDEVRVKKEK